MSIKPLEGVRVVDFSKVLAGPICTQALSELGAEIIKVESIDGGDDTRGWPPFIGGSGAVFHYANRAKRSLALDLKSPDAREIISRLVQGADVVVESFGTGVAERLKIDFDSLKAINPRIIYCSISGYGRVGPLAHGKGYDMILQAFVGMCSIMGEPDSGPVRAPFSPVDQSTGSFATSGILAALLNLAKTGQGCRVDVSLFETGIAGLGYMFQSFWERGTEPQRFGCAHESLCPYEAYRARDTQILLGVASEGLWRKLCSVLSLGGIAEDARFNTNARRVENRVQIAQILNEVFSTQDAAYWQDLLIDAGIPAAKINSFRDAITHPHTKASGIIMELETNRYGTLQTIGQPIQFNGKRSVPAGPAPALGEHTRDVMRSLQFSDEEVDRMCSQKTILAE